MVRISRRHFLQGVAAGATIAGLGPPVLAGAHDAARDAMARATGAFLDTLTPALRARATFAFTDEERLNWHYVPRRRQGVAFKDLGEPARAAAHALMQASLSGVGYEKAVNVIRLEEVLRQTETFGALRRDSENYFVTVFGTPGPGAPWGWRLEGHHLSLNFTVVPDRPVAVTPAFLGANPAEVRTDPHRGLRTLAAEQDLGLALARSVDADLRSRLVISDRSLGDIVSGPGREQSLAAPAGIALGTLHADQRAQAVRLLETYARNMRAEVADIELGRIHAAGLERVYFAWAGPIDPSRPHYYRLHGPTVLIEYDNTQNDANHIHSVWHDPGNRFGADALRAHYQHDHHDNA